VKPLYSLLGLARRSGRLICGMSNCLQAITQRQARLILITEDAGSSRKKVVRACSEGAIEYLQFGTKEDFGRYLGRPSCVWAIMSDQWADGFRKKMKACGISDEHPDRC
jgi:ribosomal protein L7Ae-like RNA K-turn-binding protein